MQVTLQVSESRINATEDMYVPKAFTYRTKVGNDLVRINNVQMYDVDKKGNLIVIGQRPNGFYCVVIMDHDQQAVIAVSANNKTQPEAVAQARAALMVPMPKVRYWAGPEPLNFSAEGFQRIKPVANVAAALASSRPIQDRLERLKLRRQGTKEQLHAAGMSTREDDDNFSESNTMQINLNVGRQSTSASNSKAATATATRLRSILEKHKIPLGKVFKDADQDPDFVFHCFSVSVIPGIDKNQVMAAIAKLLGGTSTKSTIPGEGDYLWDFSKKVDGFGVSFYDDADNNAAVVRVAAPT